MNRNKKIAYCDGNTQVGIHTANGTMDGILDIDECNANSIVTDSKIVKVKGKNCYGTYIRINPNANNCGYIHCEYSTFKTTTQSMFDELKIKDFEWKRVDLSFNTLDGQYYQNYVKLNRLLIACIADSANDTNTYDTKNFWNGYYSGSVVKTKI